MDRLTRDLYIGAAGEWNPSMHRFCVAVEVHGHDVPLVDGDTNPDDLVVDAVRGLDNAMRMYRPVYLCCVHGNSRSAYVAALWLAWYLDASWEWVVGYVKTRRYSANIHPAHMAQAERVLEVLKHV